MNAQTPSAPGTPIVVGTDFSATAGAALDWAVELARQQRARLELVHAVTLPPSIPGYVPTPDTGFQEEVRRAAVARLEEAAGAARQSGVEITTWLEVGTPSQVILDRAAEVAAQAIVVGTRGLTGMRHLLLGSTAQRVVHGALCPVLSVHPGDLGKHRAIRAILVPTDFSEDAQLAIATARRLLAPLDGEARLILVHAYNLPIEYTAYGPIPTSVSYLQDTGLETERRLFEIAQGLREQGLSIETVAREGDPAHVIAEEAAARGADLIAMGTRGLTGIRHLLMGSTAERVVEFAPCPVMTVRRPTSPTPS